MSTGSNSFSLLRILLVALPAVLIVWGVKAYTDGYQQQAESESVRSTFRQMLWEGGERNEMATPYADEDGDLVADPPNNLADCIDPEQLVFSYYASTDQSDEKEAWAPILEALSERTGRPVVYTHFSDVEEKLRAFREGRLHITAFGTGAAPAAVNRAGFTPFCCLADETGDYSYSMKIIVPADSDLQEVGQLRGGRITFTRPRSNSGYKAALVMLIDEHGMQPERDYAWGFSYGHDNSILGVAEGTFEAATVASDVLERMIARGDVAADQIRTIYESPPHPRGVIGYAYNLTPEIQTAIRETLLGYELRDSTLARQFGTEGEVEWAVVDYAQDWAPVRHIQERVAALRARLD